jgi:hypothetical protein
MKIYENIWVASKRGKKKMKSTSLWLAWADDAKMTPGFSPNDSLYTSRFFV